MGTPEIGGWSDSDDGSVYVDDECAVDRAEITEWCKEVV
jgi:hypothetical protein